MPPVIDVADEVATTFDFARMTQATDGLLSDIDTFDSFLTQSSQRDGSMFQPSKLLVGDRASDSRF